MLTRRIDGKNDGFDAFLSVGETGEFEISGTKQPKHYPRIEAFEDHIKIGCVGISLEAWARLDERWKTFLKRQHSEVIAR